MQKFFITTAMFFIASMLAADIVMHLEMPRKRYMIFEPLIANLTLRNTSGQVLVFGTEAEFQGHLEIGLFNMYNRPQKGSGTKINLKGLVLRPGVDHQIRVNIGKWLDMRRTGFYKLKVYISHPMLKNDYESNFTSFDIASGKEVWKRTFGIPNLQGAQLGEDLKMRSYVIKALQDNSDIYYFLFVEDDKKIYAIKYLGLLLGREKPVCELDSLNQLHVLLPTSPREYRYTIYDWFGKVEKVSRYRPGKTQPVLYRQSNSGDVSVIGGELIHSDESYDGKQLLHNLPADAELPSPRNTKKPSDR